MNTELNTLADVVRTQASLNAALGEGDLSQHRRERQLRDRRHLEGDHPHHDHEARTLPQDVHAEAADAGGPSGAVVVEQRVDPLLHLLVGDEAHRDGPRLLRRERLLRHRHEFPVDAGTKDVAGLDVQVRRPTIDCRLDDLFHESIPRVLVYHVAQRLSPRVARPVVEKQVQRAPPEKPR